MASPNVPVWLIPTVRTDGSNVSDELTRFSRKETFRYPFDRDYGIICHSSKFRRLTGKTQVFVHPKNDYPRTRLTHSIEVAQLGRELAAIFRHEFEKRYPAFTLGPAGTFERLVETACLAHDLGHPPFGHAGAKVLEELCAGVDCAFDDNKHTVRYFLGSGSEKALPVTNVLLDAVLKYKPLRNACYPEHEVPCRDLITALETGDFRHPATYLMEIADDLVNFTSDLEDARHLGLLSDTDRDYFFRHCVFSLSEDKDEKQLSSDLFKHLVCNFIKPALNSILDDITETDIGASAEHFPKIFQMRIQDRATPIHDWKKKDKDCLSVLSTIITPCKDEIPQTLTKTFKTLYKRHDKDTKAPEGILKHSAVENPEMYAKQILRELWDVLSKLSQPIHAKTFNQCSAFIVLPESMRTHYKRFFNFEIDQKALYTELAHYLAGMTEKYCVSLHKKLMKPSTELFEEAIEI